MLKLLTERKKRYWIVIGIIAILTYGFLLANQSIGVDDENFAYYYDNYGIAITGRYGYLLLMQLFDTYEYFPVWRDGIAVVLLVLGATFFASLFQRLANDNLSEDVCIVFSGLIVSYPLLGKMYVYISINIEVSLMLVLAAIAAYLTFRFFENRKVCYIIVSVLLLTLGISMIENCLNYYVTGVILGLWTIIVYENKRYSVPYDSQKKELMWIFKALVLCAAISAASIVFNYLIGHFLVRILKIEYVGYSQKFIVWNFSDMVNSLKLFLVKLFKVFWHYWKKTFYFKVYVWAILLFGAVSAVYAYMRKKISVLLLGVGGVISTFIFYIITGNADMAARTFVVYALFVGFAFAELYTSFAKKKYMRKLAAFLIIVVIFYQSREIQQIFRDDYGRYIKDANLAREINEEVVNQCGGLPSVPVVFIGTPLPYLEYPNEGDDVNMRSMYSGNNDGVSVRIHPFFDMLGYHYLSPLGAEITPKNILLAGKDKYTESAKQFAKDMPAWPTKGYVKATDQLIVVKLGPLQNDYYNLSQDEFEKGIDGEKCLETNGKLMIARQDGDIVYIRGTACFPELSSQGTRISVILDKGNQHFILATEQSESKDRDIISEVDRGIGNINAFLIWRKIPELESGRWRIRILLENGRYKGIISDENVKYIEIN